MSISAKEFLEQYDAICKELDWLDTEFERLKKEVSHYETDGVIGSSRCEPYQSHPVTIGGYVPNKKVVEELDGLVKQYNVKREQALVWKSETEALINQVSDAKGRMIIRYRYINDMTWQQIADKLGGNNTEESTKKYCQRIIKNLQMSHMSHVNSL